MDDENKTDGFRNKLMRSSRAKNQTVMLTPEIAAQVRAAALGDDTPGIEPPPPSIDGFERPGAGLGRSSHPRENPNSDEGVFARRDASREPRHEEGGAFQFRGNINAKSFDHGGFGEEPSGVGAPPRAVRAPESRVFQEPLEDSMDGWDTEHAPQDDYMPEPNNHGQFADRFDDKFARPVPAQRPVGVTQDVQKENRDNVSLASNQPVSNPQPVRNLREEKMNPSTVRIVSHGEPTRIGGFMISFDVDPNGEVCELRKGRWMLSSRASNEGGSIVLDDPSISQLHAIVRVTNDGKIQVLDQLSEYGTGILRAGSEEEEEVVGAMVNLDHGDRVRFGKRYFYICILPQVD